MADDTSSLLRFRKVLRNAVAGVSSPLSLLSSSLKKNSSDSWRNLEILLPPVDNACPSKSPTSHSSRDVRKSGTTMSMSDRWSLRPRESAIP